MTRIPPLVHQSDSPEPDELRAAHDLLMRHYGEPVLPVSRYCEQLGKYVQCLRKGAEDNERQQDAPASPMDAATTEKLLEIGPFWLTYARKSNLLFRLLYLNQEPRTVKCPEHEGHWSGCQPEPCKFGCSVGVDVTGWLP